MKLVIVSGLSGSGKSVALHTLEDQGYYCIDNLPVALLEAFATQTAETALPSQNRAAAGIDARNRPDDLRHFPETLERIGARDIDCDLLFLQADDDELLRRFSETRRRHPLSRDDLPLAEAVRHERKLLEPIACNATLTIDTTHTTVHQLRGLIRERVAERTDGALSLLFQSFGFKNGVPGDADFVFDSRCLPNPHWEPGLRPLSGRDPEVASWLEEQPLVETLCSDIQSFLEDWIPRFQEENRSYLSIAVGCTGGRHRSVYLVERLARHFTDSAGAAAPAVLTRHRELQ